MTANERKEIPDQQLQLALEKAAVFSISQADIDAELRSGTGFVDGKLRVYALYQQEISAKDAIEALKKEYGTGGHSQTFLDGGEGFVDYRPSSGMTFWRNDEEAKVTVKWSAIERRIRQLIADGDYLTRNEQEKYENERP